MAPSPPLLQALNIHKHFPGVRALDGVSLEVHPAEVLAVVGENGAGKSTLMKILAGIYRPDQGSLQLEGRPCELANVADAQHRGIMLIHQELNLAENLSIAANLFLGRETVRGGWLGWLDRDAMTHVARELLNRVGLDVATNQIVGALSPGQKQLVEIARALSFRARLIIMDEPTSSLTQHETDRLFQVIGSLKEQGVAVVYISHRLGEVREIADRVVVLRDGRNSGQLAREEATHEAMVRLMVGRELKQFFVRKHRAASAAQTVRFEIRGYRYVGGPSAAISFALRAGEIVGMAGLVGAGRSELAESLFGLRRRSAGEVLLDGRPLRLRNPRQAIAAGLLLVPEDRRHHGLILDESIRRNLALPNYDRLSFFRLLRFRQEKLMAQQMCDKLKVRAPHLGQPVGLLSGGNQQKVVLGKWLVRQPTVLMLDEPTRGVDVGAKTEIYTLMDELASTGVAILMISSDLEEILGMSDRVLVMHEGRLAGELERSDLSEEAVMRLATGG